MTTIVVGYVPKPEGWAALDAALVEARARSARLVVVNSRRPREAGSPEELAAVERRIAEAGIEHEVRTPEGGFDPAEDLLAIADEVGASLIVIGLRRRTPVGKLILGSSAQRVLLDAAAPVLAVKVDPTA